jgi:hypothetical protein
MRMLGTLLAAGTVGSVWLAICLIGGIFSLGALVFWIWMLVEALTRETDEGNNRLIWVLVIVFAHWIGALIYLLARRPERIRKLGR